MSASKMMTKLETTSARVKGLSFHPKRPWILASLHNGSIQLWNYHRSLLLEKFEGHTGPVRGICFHNQQPLFVSGGDDYTLRVWNYTQKRCVFILMGHIDYVRTTMFHNKYPWIISASDDQTVRIWNWQSRSCICMLTGHTHYVMCATFHPTEDLVISASLDQSVRVWDISELRKRNISLAVGDSNDHSSDLDMPNLFALPGAVVKHVLEGHECGVNWACFHPKLPLIATGSDDHTVKLWRTNESKAWEVDSCRGHYGNVSCVLFHPKRELLISDSEDRTIRVWDLNSRTCIRTIRKDQHRFWILAQHPTLNLFAAGHDAGLIVFKLTSERPVYSVHNNYLFYVKDNYLRKLDFRTQKDSQVLQLQVREGTTASSVHFNALQHTIVVCYSHGGGAEHFCDLYTVPDEDKAHRPTYKRYSGTSAVWISGHKLAVMDKSQVIHIKNLKNTVTRKINGLSCSKMFPASVGMLLLQDVGSVTLFDAQQKHPMEQVKIDDCRRALWSENATHVALLAKRIFIVCDKKLKVLFGVQESDNIKSGAWCYDAVFVYNTNTHVKYALVNGDRGIIRTIDAPIYILKIVEDTVFCLNRNCVPQTFTINTIELKFKVSLLQNDMSGAVHVLKDLNFVGNTFVSYMQQKGYSDLALGFVKDDRTRFSLALESGHLSMALKAAQALNEMCYWVQLADNALLYGNYGTAEMCYWRTKSFSKLSFLYLITGNLDKLRKLLKISEVYSSNNVSVRFQTALLLGDTEEMAKMLRDSKLDRLVRVLEMSSAYLFRPAPPIQTTETDWPLLNVHRSIFENVTSQFIPTAPETSEAELCWSDSNEEINKVHYDSSQSIETGWDIETSNVVTPPQSMDVSLPITSKTVTEANDSRVVIAHIAAGLFESAFQALQDQFSVVNFIPYRCLFMQIYSGSRAVTSFQSNIPSTYFFCMHKAISNDFKFDSISQHLQLCYNLTTAGKFTEAIDNFQALLLKATLLPVQNRKEKLSKCQAVINICARYVLALKMEMLRKCSAKNTREEKTRQCELAVYFTHCDLELVHCILTLRTAMKVCFEMKNFKTAGVLAERLLDLRPHSNIAHQVQKLLQACHVNFTDEIFLNYDMYNPFRICGVSYTPIYYGNPGEKCSLCGTAYLPQYKGFVCNVCNVAEIGKVVSDKN